VDPAGVFVSESNDWDEDQRSRKQIHQRISLSDVARPRRIGETADYSFLPVLKQIGTQDQWNCA